MENTYEWMKEKFMWNWLIRLTMETSLELTMTAMMALQVSLSKREHLWIETADYVFSILLLLWVFAYIAFVVYYYP